MYIPSMFTQFSTAGCKTYNNINFKIFKKREGE